jgi:hypothetical protein
VTADWETLLDEGQVTPCHGYLFVEYQGARYHVFYNMETVGPVILLRNFT